jgi:hypothetical protein
MSDRFDESSNRRDVVRIPAIWVAFALSLLIHLALLWQWLPRMHLFPAETPERNEAGERMQVRLAPPPSLPSAPSPAPAREAQAPSARSASPPKAAARSLPRPKIALARPARESPAIRPPAAAPPPARPPAAGDLASYVEARRLARGESAASAASAPSMPPAEDDNARSKRIIAANLGTDRAPTYGNDPRRGGGVFEIVRMGYDDGEFMFYGWNKDIARVATQMISVKRGSNSDMRVAFVRKMIEIIRSQEKEDFIWESKRLGRSLTLSARAEDNAGLEDFLIREFFDGTVLRQ